MASSPTTTLLSLEGSGATAEPASHHDSRLIRDALHEASLVDVNNNNNNSSVSVNEGVVFDSPEARERFVKKRAERERYKE